MVRAVDRTTKYAENVLGGVIKTGELVQLAAQRHINDMQNTKFGYKFDADAAQRAIAYMETLTLIEGDESKPFNLFGFQDFLFGNWYGWKNSTNHRRFRTSYVELARQNGKSIVNGGNASYIGNFLGYNFGQLYFAATKRDQARIVFNEVVKFLKADTELAELFKVYDWKSEILCLLTNSTMRTFSRDVSNIDGFRPLFASIDEYHAHKTNQMFKQCEGGTGRMAETLISVITTAGFDLNSPCYEMRKYGEQILRGVATLDTRFVAIFTMDKDDDIWDSSNWIKSNPLVASDEMGIANLQAVADEAKRLGGYTLRDFMTKRLNIWVKDADNQYIDVAAWENCASDKTLEDTRGRSCYVGLDLSSGGDLSTFALDFPPENRGKRYLYSHSFMPRARLNDHIRTDDAPYDMWARDGLITITGGESDYKNDYKFIIKELIELRDKYDLTYIAVGYDPHNADGFLQDLEELGCDLVMIAQNARTLNDATDSLRLEVKSHEVEYDRKNELLTWSFINADTVCNSLGDIKVDKKPKARNKRIDPVDAAIDAHVLAIKQGEAKVDYDAEMQKYLKMMGWDKK